MAEENQEQTEPIEIDLSEGTDTIETEEGLSTIDAIVYATNKMKQPMDAAPTYTPTNFYEQFAHYGGKLYVNINNTWTAVGGGAKARAYLGTQQAVADNTPTVVDFDTVTYDTDSAFNTSTNLFTCPRDGYYSVTVALRWDPNAADDNYVIYTYLNSTAYAGYSGYSVTTGSFSLEVTDVVSASAGDTISAKFTHTAGVSTNILVDSTRTRITIHEL